MALAGLCELAKTTYTQLKKDIGHHYPNYLKINTTARGFFAGALSMTGASMLLGLRKLSDEAFVKLALKYLDGKDEAKPLDQIKVTKLSNS